MALLDLDSLVQAASDELIVPIEPLADPAITETLYPVAVELATQNDQLYGMPYLLETGHVVYRDTIFQDPPNSFEAILTSPVAFVFPAGALGPVNQTLLLQYLSAGGTLTNEEGFPQIDRAALIDVLQFYDDANTADIIDPEIFQLTAPVESWEQYLERQTGLAAVTSTLYLNESEAVRSTGLTWTPTYDGAPQALVTGWFWVITTQDPDRQAMAMALINFLMNPVNQGAYSQGAGWLPTQQTAFTVWGSDNAYAGFGDMLLSQASTFPDPIILSIVGPVLQEAMEDVLINGISPVQAANDAAQKINPSDEDDS
jgi:ABC-type glycerol-3-phosphate transport system substrate-binding protein